MALKCAIRCPRVKPWCILATSYYTIGNNHKGATSVGVEVVLAETRMRNTESRRIKRESKRKKEGDEKRESH